MKSASSWTERWSSSGHDRRPNRMAAKTRSISRAIAAVCAGAACVAALAGCGTSTAGNVTLEFFQYKVEAVSQFKKLVKGFEAEHPNITIDIINTADAATDLRTRFVKNKVPDVLTVDGGRYFGEFAASGIFQDFTDDEILDNINPQMSRIWPNCTTPAPTARTASRSPATPTATSSTWTCGVRLGWTRTTCPKLGPSSSPR